MFWDLRLPGKPIITGFGESNFAAAKTLSSDVWVQAMNDNSWIRFISVRHPLARLYSGWNSNLSRSNKNAAAMSKGMVKLFTLSVGQITRSYMNVQFCTITLICYD